jgi:hypothetical protein
MAASSLGSTAIAAPGPAASAPTPAPETAEGSGLKRGTYIALLAILIGGVAIYFAARKHHHHGNSP